MPKKKDSMVKLVPILAASDSEFFSRDPTVKSVRVAGTDREKYYTYGPFKLDANNPFKRYHDLPSIDPYVDSSLNEVGLMIGKGFELYVDEKAYAGSGGDRLSAMLDEANSFAKKHNLDLWFSEVGRMLVQYGTVVLCLTSTPPLAGEGATATDWSFGGVQKIEVMPMDVTTLLPVGINPGEGLSITDRNRLGVLTGEIGMAVMYEGDSELQRAFPADRLIVFRSRYLDHRCYDLFGRETFGLYGRSYLESIDRAVKQRLDLVQAYADSVVKNGAMHLHYDFNLLAELVKGSRNTQQAIKTIKEGLVEFAKGAAAVRAGENVVTAGCTVQPIQGTVFNSVRDMKESLETDTWQGLLNTQTSAGKSAGSTFASAYMADARKLEVIESLRRIVRRGFEELLRRHLALKGYVFEADYIRIALDELQETTLTPRDVMDLNAQGVIDDQTMLDIFKIHAKPGQMARREAAKPVEQKRLESRAEMVEKISASVLDEILAGLMRYGVDPDGTVPVPGIGDGDSSE